MIRATVYLGVFMLHCALVCSTCAAQEPAKATSQTPNAEPAALPAKTPEASSAAKPEAAKPRKVWTNDDVRSLHSPISVVGNSKNLGKPDSDTKADPQYIANRRKQLQKLQSQLDDTNKQLSDLTDFSEGKTAVTSGGYQFTKGYNRVPVDQQISNLKAKKGELEEKIGALLDEARKKGVEPGDLR